MTGLSLILWGSLGRIQPLHVITYAVFERKAWLVPKRAARVREIGLRKVLIVRVRIIEIFRLKVCAQTFVQNLD